MVRFPVALVVASLLAVAGCSGTSTTPSATALLPGNWAGTVSDSYFGAGSVTVTFAQSGSAVTGTWSSTYAASTSPSRAGTLSGTLTGVSLDAVFTPNVSFVPSVPSSCPFRVRATLGSAEAVGSYASMSCNVFQQGSIDILPSSAATTTTIAPASITENFTGTLSVGGAANYFFSVAQNGTVNVTLVSVTGTGVPATVLLNLGVGTPNGSGGCNVTNSTTARASTAPQITSTNSPAAYCVQVADPGNLVNSAAFVITIAHP